MAEDAAAGHNVPKPEQIQDAIKRVMNVEAELASMKGEYMSACKDRREDIKSIYKDAKADGIDTRALKAKIKIMKHEQKIEEVKVGLDGDQYTMLEIIDEAVPPKGANDNAEQQAAV